jgi:hypothetical protein
VGGPIAEKYEEKNSRGWPPEQRSTRRRTHVVGPHSREVRRETFVEPNVLPPMHGDHVAEPGVGQLVRDDVGHLQLSGSW